MVFAAVPQGLANVSMANFWCILYFYCVILITVDMMFVYFFVIFSCIRDCFDVPKRHELRLKTGMVITFCIFGLIFTTHGAVFVFKILNDYNFGWNCAASIMLECIAITLYGACLLHGADFLNIFNMKTEKKVEKSKRKQKKFSRVIRQLSRKRSVAEEAVKDP